MATVYRKTVTRKLPAGAELFTRKGQRLARWKDRSGKRLTAPVIEGRDGSLRVRTEAGTFTAKYRDGSGVVREVATGCKSKDAAQSVLNELTAQAERIRSGIVTSAESQAADHTTGRLVDYFALYLDHLRSGDASPEYVANMKYLADRVFVDCGWRLLRDLSADRFGQWLANQKSGGMGARARNQYLQAVRQFGKWCVETGRLVSNPFARVAKADEAADRRLVRRSLTPAELERLLRTARWRPLAEYGRESIAKPPAERRGKRDTWTLAPLEFDDLPAAVERARDRLADNPELLAKLDSRGRGRALTYKALVLTGLRRGELASLTVGSLVLDAPTPYLVLEAGKAKNRLRTELPLRADLAKDLAEWIVHRQQAVTDAPAAVLSLDPARRPDASLPPNTPLLDVPKQLVNTLNRDLAAAGIAKVDDRGHSIDVHALRHSFGTLLSAGGVAPRTAQAAMRHSSIDLTMNVYTDPRMLDVMGALDALPALPLGGPLDQSNDDHRQRATGTDARDTNPSDRRCTAVDKSVAPTVAPNSGKPCNSGAIADNSANHRKAASIRKTPGKQAFPGDSTKAGDRDRTDDIQLGKLALYH